MIITLHRCRKKNSKMKINIKYCKNYRYQYKFEPWSIKGCWQSCAQLADVREIFTLYSAEPNDAHTCVSATDGTLPGTSAETEESRSRFQQPYITDEKQHQDAARSRKEHRSITLPPGLQTPESENFRPQGAGAMVRKGSVRKECERDRGRERVGVGVAQLRGEIRVR